MKNVPTNLSNLKSKVDKLDVDKLVPVPVDLSKLSNVVKNDVVKKDVYNAKIKNIEDKITGITDLANNTTFDAKIYEVKNEIPSFTNVATHASLNTKINEVKGKIPAITNLATTPTFTTVENKIKEIKDIKDKYFITPDYKKFTNIILDEKTAAKKLFNEFKVKQDEIVKLQTYDLSLFIGQSYFVNNGAQLYLIFQVFYHTLKRLGDTEKAISWKSNGLSAENPNTLT